jgi:hypothetical protein
MGEGEGQEAASGKIIFAQVQQWHRSNLRVAETVVEATTEVLKYVSARLFFRNVILPQA